MMIANHANLDAKYVKVMLKIAKNALMDFIQPPKQAAMFHVINAQIIANHAHQLLLVLFARNAMMDFI